MAVNASLYDTRALVANIELMKPPSSFLIDTFFPNVQYSDTEFVSIDIFVVIVGQQCSPLAPIEGRRRRCNAPSRPPPHHHILRPPHIHTQTRTALALARAFFLVFFFAIHTVFVFSFFIL